MKKNEICQSIEAVCKALDNITVCGIANAGNLAGCFSILQDVLVVLKDVEFKEENEK